MKVLSLFDGMSCGQIALKRLGIRTETYYASEIDRHAIRQTQLNFPDTIQLGDVTQVDVRQLEPIDLLIGGSPCQSFSFAGKRAGMSTIDKEEIYTLKRYLELKREGFLFEGESYLFWEYMRILTDIRMYNPDVLFLLENVEMGKKWERVLSEAIGIFGVHINSALMSAQNRARIYWTNIRTKKVGLFGELHADIPQPQDRKIFLRQYFHNVHHRHTIPAHSAGPMVCADILSAVAGMVIHSVRCQESLGNPGEALLYQSKLSAVAGQGSITGNEGLQHIDAVQPYFVFGRAVLGPAVPVIVSQRGLSVFRRDDMTCGIDMLRIRQIPVEVRADLHVIILSIGSAQQKRGSLVAVGAMMVYITGQIAAQTFMAVSVGYDHRVQVFFYIAEVFGIGRIGLINVQKALHYDAVIIAPVVQIRLVRYRGTLFIVPREITILVRDDLTGNIVRRMNR